MKKIFLFSLLTIYIGVACDQQEEIIEPSINTSETVSTIEGTNTKSSTGANERTLSTQNTQTTELVSQILIVYKQGTSLANRETTRQCLSDQIGRYVVNIERCEENPNSEFLRFYKVLFNRTDNNADSEEDKDTLEKPDVLVIDSADLINIINSCDTHILTHSLTYDCSIWGDFVYVDE